MDTNGCGMDKIICVTDRYNHNLPVDALALGAVAFVSFRDSSRDIQAELYAPNLYSSFLPIMTFLTF